jgi:hypothetical protein
MRRLMLVMLLSILVLGLAGIATAEQVDQTRVCKGVMVKSVIDNSANVAGLALSVLTKTTDFTKTGLLPCESTAVSGSALTAYTERALNATIGTYIDTSAGALLHLAVISGTESLMKSAEHQDLCIITKAGEKTATDKGAILMADGVWLLKCERSTEVSYVIIGDYLASSDSLDYDTCTVISSAMIHRRNYSEVAYDVVCDLMAPSGINGINYFAKTTIVPAHIERNEIGLVAYDKRSVIATMISSKMATKTTSRASYLTC